MSVGSFKLWLFVVAVFLLESAGFAMPIDMAHIQSSMHQVDPDTARSNASHAHAVASHDSTSNHSASRTGAPCKESQADRAQRDGGDEDSALDDCACQGDRCGCAISIVLVANDFHAVGLSVEFDTVVPVRSLHINLASGDWKPPFRPPITSLS